jgi:hypothetical protein
LSALPGSIQIGRCYLTSEGRVRRVLSVEGGKVLYEAKDPDATAGSRPRMATLPVGKFVAGVEREIPCDWTLETDRAQGVR